MEGLESSTCTPSTEHSGALNGVNVKHTIDVSSSKRKRTDDALSSSKEVETAPGSNGETVAKPAEDGGRLECSSMSVSPSCMVPAKAAESTNSSGGPGRRSSARTVATAAGKREGDGSDADSATDLEENEFFVEKILDYVRENGVDMFLIKWKGWGNAYNTWEPQDNLSCLEMMIDFFKERELAHQNKRRKTEPSLARDQYLKMFVEEHFQPTQQQLAEEFARHAVDGQLKFKEKLKPLEMTHMEIESFVRRNGVKATSMKALRKVQQLKSQLLQHRLITTRDMQQVRLKQWEDDINSLCSDTARITVENNVDLALPPENFIYKNDYVPGEGVTIPSDPVVGCECSVCYPGTSCCSQQAGAPAAYTKTGKLRLQIGQPIYECNKTCRCSEHCFNRVVQRGRKVRLSIFRTANGCGWGVKAMEAIKRGTFVTEYVGEVITNEEAERRGKNYDSVGVTYLFDLDFNDQINLYTVDAAVYGNVSHFINHSCEPNLVVFVMWSDCLDPNLPRLALFACRDIARGEQLHFDYNSPLGSNSSAKQPSTPTAGAVPGVKPSPPVDGPRTPSRGQTAAAHEPPGSPTKSPRRSLGHHPSARTSCRCGAKACRRYLF